MSKPPRAGKTLDSVSEAERRIEHAAASPETALNLDWLDLTDLPESIFLLRQLLSLSVPRNRLTKLPESIAKLTKLQRLDVSGNQLSTLPESIAKLTKLQRLDVSSNQLSTLPEFIAKLTKLQNLDVSGNQLSTLPESVGQLRQLRRLILYSNRFRRFPDSVREMSQLESLSLSDNPLNNLPSWFANLKQLRFLAIAGTEIEALPEGIRELTRLECLALGGGPLRRLPEWIGKLKALNGLDLSYGPHLVLVWEHNYKSWRTAGGVPPSGKRGAIDALPESMRSLTSLRELYLHGNDALQIPPEILGGDWGDVNPTSRVNRHEKTVPAEPGRVLEYYFRTRRGRRPLNEAKLILVGRGGVGKTCLIKRLIHDSFDENEPETPGIEIRTWPVTLSDGDSVRLHVWDFGGQEILHATHQFFLTERTLYLLVLSGREGSPAADAEYWLQLIKSFGGDSRVIIALNKSVQHPFDLNRGLLLEKYPFIADFVKTDCKFSVDGRVSTNTKSLKEILGAKQSILRQTTTPKSATGIRELNQLILRLSESMDHRKADFPADWFAIKERLAGMDEDFITWDQYQEICRASGEIDPRAQRDLAKFLHILGIALNYGDDPRLHDTRVLKPRWVTEGIYTLLRAGQKTDRKGVLMPSDMAAVLDAARYPPSKHDFLSRLMERFQLCFRLPGAEERYLVPELLGENQPDLSALVEASGLGFRYQYEVLPEGLLPRFIVQTHTRSEANPQWRWRSGVVLERDGCRAVVRADARERRVDIHITGPEARRRGLLEIIREKFEEQHRDLKGLTVDERVPVPDQPGVTVSYRHLLALEEEGEESCRPEGSRRQHRVADLLNGVESAESRASRREPKTERRLADPAGLSLEDSTARHDRVMLVSKRDKVFVSYSHKDRKIFEDFKTMLAPAIQRGMVDLWDDKKIVPGAKWKDDIKSALGAAKVAVLLVSQNFLASDFIAKHELPPLLKAAQQEGVTVFWVYLSACLYEQTEIADYQAAHDVSRPLNQLDKPQREAVLSEVCAKLVRIAQIS